ncbi:MAG: phosphodiester glycosidase family protein [Candidatus Margulisbacteria bacterium]|nr:phosphodiester glycosidase family protein [Candidatus Margulisiibacteriota bacterium]MBU1021779.1 phosphodiester glycosidase family protein [Candidatus Margulisiibacteriota bacterium]MBU1729525.1 phosphodiester glycosidase family protein [Candidatus Margulisiibacteriota bacterium]MBU1955374.1 phosphodiester glycosidase family protein [Candidatus Margulisiibacteriota bacterium]
MKINKYLILGLLIALLSAAALFAATPTVSDPQNLLQVRSRATPENLRVVFDFTYTPEYTVSKTKEAIDIIVKNSGASSKVNIYEEINDPVLAYVEITKVNDDLKIHIPLYYPVENYLFRLDGPPRLVIDLGREFKKVVQTREIQKGLELWDIKIGNAAGIANAQAVLVDQRYNIVFPALPPKPNKSFVESFTDIFMPWGKREEKPFYIDTVSQIAKKHNAQAAINGTFFASNGLPLGILMINGELISYPVYERTALIFTDDGQTYIDNLMMKSFFHTQQGILYEITGINTQRPENGVTIFTPVFGKNTNTKKNGLEITVEDGRVKRITLGSSDIPESGYVLSATGAGIEYLANDIKVGEKIDVTLRLVPYNENLKSPLLHLLGGGPRLVKKGTSYISKHEEKFKQDVANGRRARSAVGITKDQKLLLVTVDQIKRSTQSVGANLEELANLMIFLGAIDAMNLDGGGSSTLVVNDQVINHPSGGSERYVSNALIVKPK